MIRAVLTFFLLFLTGCVTVSHGHGAFGVGAPASGYIHARGVSLPDRGEGFVRARVGETTRYGTSRLVSRLVSLGEAYAHAFPGTPPLVIGDLSAPFGGRHTRHHSHRSGRDVDVIYPAVNDAGERVSGASLAAFDRYGITNSRDGAKLAMLDVARLWFLMRTLLLDDETPVQWIFCSDGVKARVLSWAIQTEQNPEALVRASYVLHRPTDGEPHDDHFHVRIACTPEERSQGCVDSGPNWPWFPPDFDKPLTPVATRDDDATLIRALLGER